ncbi:hypothetical protein ACOMHN_029912 [Nucella lapillus]
METLNVNQGKLFSDITSVSQELYRPGISIEEAISLYDKWAAIGNYDQLHAQANYFNAYNQIMSGVLELFPTKRDISILDVGSGTGIIGQKLHDEGFQTIDALDPSQEMLKATESRNVYRRFVCSFFSEDPIDAIENDTYDLLLMCGVCCPGAVPVEAFKEAIRILKPGGYIVNCMRAEYIHTMAEYKGRWEEVTQSLLTAGKWTVVSEQRYPNHFFHHEGLRQIYQVL